jgi:hypothetical protein
MGRGDERNYMGAWFESTSGRGLAAEIWNDDSVEQSRSPKGVEDGGVYGEGKDGRTGPLGEGCE